MDQAYSSCLIALLKGIVYNHQKEVWENLLRYEADIKKYFQPIGLELYLDKSEGYAYLRQIEWEEEVELPKLSEKRKLNFLTSLVCVVVRKYLLEQDAQSGSARVIISEQELLNRLKVYLPGSNDEAKQQEKIISTINKVIEIGFLRKLEGQDKNYEIHRIIKGFINADVIQDALNKLQEYAKQKKEIQ